MKSIVSVGLIFLSLGLPFACAQGVQSPSRAQFAKFRSFLDLTQTIGSIPKVDQVRGLAFTKAQAKQLLPILKDLGSRGDLKPEEAEKILEGIEGKILTSKQLQKMDDIRLAGEEERRKRVRQGDGFSLGENRGMARRGQTGGMMGFVPGKPFNPFKQERAKEILSDAIVLLQKK